MLHLINRAELFFIRHTSPAPMYADDLYTISSNIFNHLPRMSSNQNPLSLPASRVFYKIKDCIVRKRT